MNPFLRIARLFLFLCLLVPCAMLQAAKPNVLFIGMDDLNDLSLSC